MFSGIPGRGSAEGGRSSHTWKSPFHGQGHRQHRHERLVGHGIDHGADDGFEIPAAGDPAVQGVGDAGVGKQAQGRGMVVMQDAVPNEGRGDETGGGQDVRDGVDVFS